MHSTPAHFSVRGQPDSVKTVMGGQTFWRRYTYTHPGYLGSTLVSGAGIAWVPRSYAYQNATATLDSIKLGNWPATKFALDLNLTDTAVTLASGERLRDSIGIMGMRLHRKSTGAYSATTNRHFAWDPGPRLERQYYAVGGTPAKSWKFTYDSLGQLKTAADQRWTGPYPGACISLDWGYECAATQTGWTTDSSRSYTYDLAGNRTSQGGTYGSANRITAIDGCTYATDFDGNVTSRSGCSSSSDNATFTWSAEGQLKTIVAQGKTWTIAYDAAGRMVRWLDGAVVNAYFLWDGANLLAELGGTGTSKVGEYS